MAKHDVMEHPGVVEHPADVGAMLREQRLSRRIDLRAVAEALCIRPTQLRAIEEGRFSDLPGPAYAIGFLKAYADFLDLDAAAVVSRYKAAAAGTAENGANLQFPSASAEAKSPKSAVLVAGLVLAALAYTGWYVLTSEESPVAELVEPLPDRFAALVDDNPAASPDAAATAAPAAAPSSPPPPVAETAAPADLSASASEGTARAGVAETAPAERTPAIVDAEPAAPSEPTAVAAAPATAPAETAETPAEPPPSETRTAAAPPPASDETVRTASRTEIAEAPRILLRAREDSWIQVSDGSSEQVLLARLLRAGETYTVPDRGGLTLVTGNAGGLEIVVDGTVLPSLGASGIVKRGIVLEADALRQRTSALN